MERENELELKLKAAFTEWEWVYESGGYSPIWTDGRSLNFLRKRIAALKMQIEEAGYHFEICDQELPPLMDNWYMKNAQEIEESAKRILKECRENEDYRYVRTQAEFLDDGIKAKMRHPPEVMLSQVEELENAVVKNNYPKMRMLTSAVAGFLKDMTCFRGELEEELLDAIPF